jgi:hypothetical protein
MSSWDDARHAGNGPVAPGPRLQPGRRLELAAAAAAVTGALALALPPTHWPFDSGMPSRDPSLWQLLLADRLTLGFVRLSLVLLALFVIGSIPALMTAGRWMKGVGSTGVTADDASSDRSHATDEIDRLRRRLNELTVERDALLRAVAEAGITVSEPGSPKDQAEHIDEKEHA